MKKFFSTFVLLCGLAFNLFAIPARPVPARFVADFANIFTNSQGVAELEEYLGVLSDTAGVQVQVVTVLDLENMSPNEFATALINEWGIGSAGKNDGVVVLIKPRTDTKGEVYISTGYGAEAILPDALCGRIIDLYMMDYLREGDYFAAADAGARMCAKLMSEGSITLTDTDSYSDGALDAEDWVGISVLFSPFLLAFVVFMLPKNRAKRKISGARTPEKLEAALAFATKHGLTEQDKQTALQSMREGFYRRFRDADTPTEQQKLIAAAAAMPLGVATVQSIVDGMKDYTYQEYTTCMSTSRLRKLMKKAIAYGNDEASMQAMYDSLYAAARAAEIAAAREAARRRASSGSGGGGRSYGGGHGGGGGAGRSF